MLCIDFTEYSIESGNDDHVFAVSITNGSLYTVGELSYSKRKVHLLVLSTCMQLLYYMILFYMLIV